MFGGFISCRKITTSFVAIPIALGVFIDFHVATSVLELQHDEATGRAKQYREQVRFQYGNLRRGPQQVRPQHTADDIGH